MILLLLLTKPVYTIFRSTGDGTSDATAIYGVDDILEAVYRNSSSVDSPLTKLTDLHIKLYQIRQLQVHLRNILYKDL